MKKTISTLIFSLAVGMAGTTFAANPFELVPTTDWEYDSIATLARAGIYEGYRDVNFKRDQTLTRYELATLVAKAMANQTKASPEQKAIIDKLAAEFKQELTNLGVYNAAIAPAQTATVSADSNIKIGGDTRVRYEQTKNNGDTVNFRTRFTIDVKMDDKWNFFTRFVNSNNITDYGGAHDSGSSTTKINLSYVKGTVGETGIMFGRMPLALGKGLLVDTDSNWDGVKLDIGSNVKTQIGYARAADKKNYFFTDVTTNVTKDLDLTASYIKDYDSNTAAAEYQAWTAGFGFKGIKNLAAVAEYGKNDVSNAKAWMMGVTFRQADRAKVGSWDVGLSYKKAAPKFDPEYWSTADATFAMGINAMDDIQGFEYAIDYVPLKNALLHVSYGDMENYTGESGDNRQYFISNLSFKF